MTCLIKKRNKFYKKTLLDVWGHHYIYNKISKAINIMKIMKAESKARYQYYKREFVYSFQKRIRFRRQKRLKDNYIDRRYLKNFYLVLSYKNFRNYMDLAKKKKGSYIGNYLVFLEGRLFMIAYRSNFITNIFLIKYVIKNGLFTINGKVRTQFNFTLKVGDILQVSWDYKNLMFNDFLMRLYGNIIFYKTPDYLFTNYKLLFLFFWRKPRMNDLIFPVDLDILLGSEFYYP